jgi:electron transfer flavoprotein beta subunit
MSPELTVGVLLKRVDLHPLVDALTGGVTEDDHGGMSAADRCALELALQQAARSGSAVVALTAGGSSAESVLREAFEAGAARVVRVELEPQSPSEVIGAALAAELVGCRWVFAGDRSLDRGSGSVPAFVAAQLGVAQALGVTTLTPEGADALVVERRLDGGRREVLRVLAPAVISVEAGAASLRRAGLRAAIAAQGARIERRARTASVPLIVRRRPYRPRARVLPGPDERAPAWERAAALAGVHSTRRAPRVVRADSEQAVDELLSFLRERGYLEEEPG